MLSAAAVVKRLLLKFGGAHSLLHFVVKTEFVSQISPDAEYSVVADA